MSVVLDTHSIIWYLHRPEALSPRALEAIRGTLGKGQPIFMSAISMVEVIYLVERGRVPFEALRRFESAVKSAGSGLLVQPLDEAVVEAVRSVPRDVVPDMPDRIIAATAVYLGLSLVTRDRRLQEAGIATVW